MKADRRLNDTISKAASSIGELTSSQRDSGVLELLGKVERLALDNANPSTREEIAYRTELIVKFRNYKPISIKYTNFFISWRRLLIAGGSIPASYISSTLSAMTILGFMTKGSVHVFDEIDATILALIHSNSKILPLSTGEFYEQVSSQFPAEINRPLFMKRVIDLSGYGAISIDGDRIKITEAIYSFEF